MRTSIPALTAAVMLAALSLAAHADPSSATTLRGHGVVNYGDLNIESEAGAKILLQRLERAAKKACGGQATFSSYTGSLDHTFEQCWTEAIARAVKQLGAPTVTRVYAESARRESWHG